MKKYLIILSCIMFSSLAWGQNSFTFDRIVNGDAHNVHVGAGATDVHPNFNYLRLEYTTRAEINKDGSMLIAHIMPMTTSLQVKGGGNVLFDESKIYYKFIINYTISSKYGSKGSKSKNRDMPSNQEAKSVLTPIIYDIMEKGYKEFGRSGNTAEDIARLINLKLTLAIKVELNSKNTVKKILDNYYGSQNSANSNNQSGSNSAGYSSSSNNQSSSSNKSSKGYYKSPEERKAAMGKEKNKNSSNTNSSSSTNSSNNSSSQSNSSYSSSNYNQNTSPAYTGPTAAEREQKRKEDEDREWKRINKQNQENYKRNIKAVNNKGVQFTNTVSLMINQHISYNRFNSQIEENTKLSKSKDPNQIISEYNRKVKGLNQAYKNRIAEQKNEINQTVSQNKTNYKGDSKELNDGLNDVVGEIAKNSTENRLKKEEKAAQKRLAYEKEQLLRAIQKDLIFDFEKKRSKYVTKAAAQPNQTLENYYKKMANFYDCKISGVKYDFSTTNTSWVDPYCSLPSDPPSSAYRSPSSSELYNASKRKRISSNPEDKKYAGQFLNMAIKKSPSNTTYLFERASYYPLGSQNNVNYLAKCVNAKPSSSKYQNYYHYAYALNKEESRYFKAYLKKHPKGTFTNEAKQKYDYYLDREVRENLYRQDIEELNLLLKKEKFAEASNNYKQIKNDEFFSSSHIPQLNLLKEYIQYQDAIANNNSPSLISYLKNYPNGKWKMGIKFALEKTLINDADNAFNKKKMEKAIEHYNKYLQYLDKGERRNYAKKQINAAHDYIKKKLITDADNAYLNKEYRESFHIFDSYLTKYPNGEKKDYALEMREKAKNKFVYKERAIGAAGIGIKSDPGAFLLDFNTSLFWVNKYLVGGIFTSIGSADGFYAELGPQITALADFDVPVLPYFTFQTGVGVDDLGFHLPRTIKVGSYIYFKKDRSIGVYGEFNKNFSNEDLPKLRFGISWTFTNPRYK